MELEHADHGSEVSFQHLGRGFCQDGGDLLEGPLDNYGGLSPLGGARSPESSLFYGSRCRERCGLRPRCRAWFGVGPAKRLRLLHGLQQWLVPVVEQMQRAGGVRYNPKSPRRAAPSQASAGDPLAVSFQKRFGS